MNNIDLISHGSLFSGIGGFDIASNWCGIKNIFQVENDTFCKRILEKNFPKTKKYNDIKEFNGIKYEGKIDILSGGFPCQPFSHAGRKKGEKDSRYLWDEMFRVIKEVKPEWVIIENVYGLLTLQGGVVLEKVLADMESEKFEVQPFIIPACSKNSPHRRDRIWIVANSESNRSKCKQKRKGVSRNEYHKSGRKRMGNKLKDSFDYVAPTSWNQERIKIASKLCGRDDGISNSLDRSRNKALGNAIVPQVAFEILSSIINVMKKNNLHR